MGRKRKTTQQFISEAKFVHGKRWIYHNSIYEYSTKKITIGCVLHGDYQQTPAHHLEGQVCPSCGNMNRTRQSRGVIIKKTSKYSEEICYLYHIKLTGNGETFYKWGISIDYIYRHKRICRESRYNIEVLDIIIDTRYNCASLENKLLTIKRDKGLQYKPKNKFGGWTECYI